jgi:hypothetical protein
MIALHFGIPLDKVEECSIVNYRLMLFTIFNNASMTLGGEYKMQTPDEEQDTLEAEIEMFKKMGFLQ